VLETLARLMTDGVRAQSTFLKTRRDVRVVEEARLEIGAGRAC
jgi:hypothetical protein